MNSLEARIAQCLGLQKIAIRLGDQHAYLGYHSEFLGLQDAHDGRPCDPEWLSGYEHRYLRGYEDAQTILKLEERASVGA